MVALESAELFRNLRPEELKALRQVTVERKFAAGKDIFREGDCGDGVYIVKEGLVEISGALNANTRRVFSQIGPGGMFGEMAVLEHRPRSACATAATDTTVYLIPRGELLFLIERSSGLALSLLQAISHRLRQFDQHYLEQVVQAERLAVLGRFARAIVHDLKNPLTVISLTAELVCAADATPEARAVAHDRIHRQIERINDLVGEILQFTQDSQAGLALVPVDYAAFVRQVVAELRQETESKFVRLELADAPPAVRLRMDSQRMRRVFINLVANATDAMPGDGTVTLRFSQDAREVLTEIEDTGPGIAPEIADKLFQAFATHGKEHGTGLGLSICKKIIEDHGGRIEARNVPGGGAVFAFTLPLPK